MPKLSFIVRFLAGRLFTIYELKNVIPQCEDFESSYIKALL